MVYLSLSSTAPADDLAADCQLVSDEDRCQLRSANSRMCHHTDLQQLWRQIFCCCRSETVENLPAHRRQTDIGFEQFKRLLKTFLVVNAGQCG